MSACRLSTAVDARWYFCFSRPKKGTERGTETSTRQRAPTFMISIELAASESRGQQHATAALSGQPLAISEGAERALCCFCSTSLWKRFAYTLCSLLLVLLPYLFSHSACSAVIAVVAFSFYFSAASRTPDGPLARAQETNL